MSEKPESTVTHAAKWAMGVALVVGLIAALYQARSVLILILIAAVLALGMEPGIRVLQRRGRMGRGAATAVILFSLLGFLVLFFVLVIPPIAGEVEAFARRVPDYIAHLEDAGGVLGEFEQRFNLSEQLENLADRAPELAQNSAGTVLGVFGNIAVGLFSLLTILVLTVYFASNLPTLENGVASLFPPAKRDEFRELMDRATEKIGGYSSGQLTVSLIAGVCAFIAFLIIGLPFPAALAMWVSITTLIPSVGALVGAVLCILVASFVSIGTAIITAIYILVYQQIENYVISPRVMKKAVDLSPAAVIVSVLIGGSMLGFVGALLALPIAAAAKVVVRDLWLRNRLEPPPKKRAARRKPSATAAVAADRTTVKAKAAAGKPRAKPKPVTSSEEPET
ncbi:AI-2E family transporter [soil metagenome]